MKLKLKKVTNLAFKDDLEELLFEYEAAEQEIASLQEENEVVFGALVELEDRKVIAKERMKRLVYEQREPPKFLKGRLYRGAVEGDLFQVNITYKQNRYYNPEKLPDRVLLMPGVVVDVDRKSLDDILETTKDNVTKAAIKQALVQEWMTPALEIKRRTE